METLGRAAAVECRFPCSHAGRGEGGVLQPPLILLRGVSAARALVGTGHVRSHAGDSAPGVPFAATPGVSACGQGAWGAWQPPPAHVSQQPCVVREGACSPDVSSRRKARHKEGGGDEVGSALCCGLSTSC